MMKTRPCLSAFALLLAGCSADLTEPTAPEAAYPTRTVRIRLTDDDPQSRTTIVYPVDDKTSKLVWSAGDRVSYYISTDAGVTFSTALSADVGPGGTVTLHSVPEAAFTIRIRYPEVEAGSAWSEPPILAEQRQTLPDKFDGSNLPLLAEGIVEAGVASVDLPYSVLGSVIRLKLTAPALAGETVRRLVFSDANALPADGSRSVALTVATPADLSAPRSYYCVVRPGTYDLSVSVETDAATYYYNGTFGQRQYGTGLHRFALALDNGLKSLRTVAADATATANCYVLSRPGSYSFDASVPGNGVTPEQSAAAGLLEAGAAYDAAWLWTTGTAAGAVVTDVRYDAERQRIRVTVPEPMTSGSVVVALYTPQDKQIVWSWHLWVNATVADNTFGTLRWMNQNLGATSPSAEAGAGSYGFYYQFGRKDPEIGANAVGTKAGVTENTAFADKTAPSTVNTAIFGDIGWAYSAGGVTLAESGRNPMRHSMLAVTGGGNSAFTAAVNMKTVWGNGIAAKTMYDPCPPGYKVPTAPQLTDIITVIKNATETKDAATNSRSYSVGGEQVWLPTPGYRLPGSAAVGVLGRTAHIWCTRGAGATNADAFTMRCTSPTGTWSRAVLNTMASGATVRCIRIDNP